MKCAKCGTEVPDDQPCCPNCGGNGHASAWQDRRENPVRCPSCGSTQIMAVRKNYDPGCGCLGLLLFGWWGLLLGLLGADTVEMVCSKCGARWPAGKPHNAQTGIGCGTLLLILLLLWLLLSCL